MPWKTVKLTPGVRSEVTPTLLEAGIAASNLIRFREGLPEKIGGWSEFYSQPMMGTPRQLAAWADLNFIEHLGVGTDQILGVITNGVLQNISPRYKTSNNAPNFSTTLNSNVVDITDAGSDVTPQNSVFIATPVSVGGIVLYGLYPVNASLGSNSYSILAASEATAAVTGGGAVPVYTTTSGSPAVNVNLANHGLAVGSTYAAPIATVVGGLTVQGLYYVNAVIDANNFTIDLQFQASSSQTVAANGGNAQIVYWVLPSVPPLGSGFGVGGFGLGGFGTGSVTPAPPGTVLTAPDWSLDNWGSTLIACPKGYGIFQWSPYSGDQGANIIAQAPYANTGFFIAMPEQQIVAYGAAVFGVSDPMLVAWCDNADYTTWIASASNQAGTYRLTRGSRIVGGLQGPQQALLWTDVGLWLMQYIGYPLVYGFNEIAKGCGLIGQHAAAVLGATVYWMSQGGFWVYSGLGVQRLQCAVWDEVFQDLNQEYAYKVIASPNTEFDEISWQFVSLGNGGTENSKYVKYNTIDNAWEYGDLVVSAWIDANVFGPPLATINPDGAGDYFIEQMETSPDADGVALNPWFETGLFVLTEGEDYIFVDYMVPDFIYEKVGSAQSANMMITLFAQDFPWSAPSVIGPYTVTSATEAISTRVRGRYFSMRVESNDLGSFWRLGGIKFRFAPDGRNG